MNNKSFYGLYMNFDDLRDNGIFPCDLDFVYKCKDGYFIIAEIKNERGVIRGMQKEVLCELVKDKGILLDLVHNKYVQNGATEVAISDCMVRAEYVDGEWKTCEPRVNAFDRIREIVAAHK